MEVDKHINIYAARFFLGGIIPVGLPVFVDYILFCIMVLVLFVSCLETVNGAKGMECVNK